MPEGLLLMKRDVIGLVAFALVKRIVDIRVLGMTLPIYVFRVPPHDTAGRSPGNTQRYLPT